jgi:hypothetical protein
MGHWTFLWITDLHYELPSANYLDDFTCNARKWEEGSSCAAEKWARNTG